MKQKLSMLFLCFLPLFVWAQEHSAEEMIQVEGFATVRQVPELMLIHITISQEDVAYATAVEKVQEKLKNMKESFKASGLDEQLIKATSFRVDERFDYNNGQRKLVGYNAVIDLSVKTTYNAQTSYKAVAALTEDKEFVDFSIGFELSEAQKKAMKDASLKMAVKDAQSKAELLSIAAGVKLGEVERIEYGYTDDSFVPAPRFFAKSERMASDANTAGMGGNLELNPKEIEISNTVQMAWEIENK